MKLKEPLQGIKMIQGHVVMHLAMFAVSNTVDTAKYMPTEDMPLQPGLELRSLWAFEYLRWGHLATALLQLAAMQL